MKLLIVDEDQHFCGILASVLGNEGHEVVAVADARSAAIQATALSPQVVLVSAELRSPGGGMEVMRSLRRLPAAASATGIVMTNFADERLRRACDETATAHVLVRPFSVLDLAGLVRSLDVGDFSPAEEAPVAGSIDLDNLGQLVRTWARRASGTLTVTTAGRVERVLISEGGPVDPGALVTLRAAVFGGDLEFVAHDPVGVGDRRSLGAALFREAELHEGNRAGVVTRAATLTRARFTDAASELPLPMDVRRLLEAVDGPVQVGAACDRISADFPAMAGALGALSAMGLLGVATAEGGRTGVEAHAVSNANGRGRTPSDDVTRPGRPRSDASARSVAPPERPFAAPHHDELSSRPYSTPPSVDRSGSTSSRPAYVPTAAAPLAEQLATLRRLRREIDLLKGSDPWVVLAVSHDAPPERIAHASQRMVSRYEGIAAQYGGEVAELAQKLLQRVRDATLELTQPSPTPENAKAQPGDEYFEAGLRAMSEGDWASADRRFTAARDAHLDSTRNLAHLGWARFHNPELPLAERVEEGQDLLLLAEQLDPAYADGQYFLAMVLHRKGADEAATRRIRRALKADPQHVSANALAKKIRRPPPEPKGPSVGRPTRSSGTRGIVGGDGRTGGRGRRRAGGLCARAGTRAEAGAGHGAGARGPGR